QYFCCGSKVFGITTAEFSLLSGFDPMFQPAQTPVTARTAGSCGWPVTPGLYPAFSFVPRYPLEIGPNSLQSCRLGQGLPLSCNRAHSPSQRDTRCFLCVPSQALLRLLPLPLFFQLVHLLLVVTVQCDLDGEDGVLIVAVPLHAVAVQIAGVFHRDEL